MVSYAMAFTTLISTATLASAPRRSGVRDRRLPLQARRCEAGENASMRRRTSRARSTRTSAATSPVPETGRTAAIPCRIRTRLHRPSAGSASRAACRWSPTTRRTACTRAGCGGCCGGSGTTRSPCSTAGSRSGRPKGAPTSERRGTSRAARVHRLAARGHGRRCRRRSPRCVGTSDVAAGRRARAGTLPRRDGADRQDARTHSRRRESLLPVESRRAGTLPHARAAARRAEGIARRASPPTTSSATADPASPRATICSRSSTRADQGAKLYAGSWSEWSARPRHGQSKRIESAMR